MAFLHRRQRQPDRVKCRGEVDGDPFVPALGGERLDGGGVPHDGVVDEDVDGAERIDAGRDHLLDLAGDAEIGAAVERPDAVLPFDVGADRGNRIGIREAVQHDVAAGFGELPRGGEAQALDRPGDERAFSPERNTGRRHHLTRLSVRQRELGDPQAGLGDPRRKEVLEPLFVDRDHAVRIAADLLDHFFGRHDQGELASGGQPDRNVLRILRVGSAQVFVRVREVAGEHPRVGRLGRQIVADVHVHRSPGVRVEGRVQVDARQHVLAVAVHAHEPSLTGEIDRPHDVRRIDAQHQPPEPPLERHRPDPLRQLALLNVERGVRELLDVAHVIEVRVRDEHARHLRPATRRTRPAPLAAAASCGRRSSWPALRRRPCVVVSDVDHRRLAPVP